MQIDPIEKTAQDLNLPKELVEIVVQDLFRAIREYIHDIHEIKLGILLPIFRIDLRPAKILGDLKLIRRKFRENDLSERSTSHWQQLYDYWESILLNLPYSDKNPKHQRYKRMYHPDRAEEVDTKIRGRFNLPENCVELEKIDK